MTAGLGGCVWKVWSHLGAALHFPKLPRSHSHIFDKRTIEGADGGEAGGKGCLGDIAATLQKSAGMFDPKTVDKVRKADIHPFLEHM
mgnify:CR=1 FL=1